ncbi:MAG: Uma2 family endonuclease [Saccharothrix sp.]|nr:Uma2 family endonuclease [Saccharothrix sp.]
MVSDVVVLNVPPVGKMARPVDLELVVEIISPGNTGQEQADKMDAYAIAGVPFYWVVRQDRPGGPLVIAYRLRNERYVEDATAEPGSTVTITAAPVPVTFDPAVLSP